MSGKKDQKEFSRRDFLKTTGAATGGIIGGSLLGGLVGFNFSNSTADNNEVVESVEADTVSSADSSSHLEARMFFKRREDFEALSAAAETIYPEDQNGPGAIALGVPFFIDKQLVTAWASNADDYMVGPFQEGETAMTRQKIFLAGVRRLNTYSQEHYDTVFKSLEENEKIEVLQAFESGDVEMDYISSSAFFALLRQSTLEGTFADPLYGGNKNMEAWKMIGYPGAQMSYRSMMEEDSPADEEFVAIDPISLSTNS